MEKQTRCSFLGGGAAAGGLEKEVVVAEPSMNMSSDPEPSMKIRSRSRTAGRELQRNVLHIRMKNKSR